MKTATTRLLKKDLLIIELPENTKSWEFLDGIFWVNDKRVFIKGFTPFHILLGSPDEIRAEDARELVKSESLDFGKPFYKNYQNEKEPFRTSTESLLSAIETVVFWQNPFGDYDTIDWFKASENTPTIQEWNEAQLRTFDSSRTKVFKRH